MRQVQRDERGALIACKRQLDLATRQYREVARRHLQREVIVGAWGNRLCDVEALVETRIRPAIRYVVPPTA